MEEEPFDASEEQFILKEMSQIRAINELQDLVRQGALKSEKEVYAREKYNEMRNTYISMLTTERTLKAEANEMEEQLKSLTAELDKILKDTVEDEETLELVREDAEQAESEAQICKEKEQTIFMEVADLSRLQELYKERIQEIEKEHATALAPLISRYKVEINGAKEAIADSMVKKEQCLKEIELCKEKLQQILDEIQQVNNEGKADLLNLEGLEGAPDKYRKQADILSTAVKALQLQDQKWNDKVKEVESEIIGLQGSAKHLTEELSNTMVQIEKTKLLTEQKEQQAADIGRDLEAATLEVDDYLADQVNVDMQLRSRSTELKLEQDQLLSRTREKDKVLRRLKIEEQSVQNIQASFPLLMTERDKIHYQVVLVENEKEKVTAMVDELRKEIDIQMHNFLVVEALGKEVSTSLRESHKQVTKLEGEVAASAEIERLKNQHINNLTLMRERMCRQAVQKHNMWKDAVKKLHMMEVVFRNTVKRNLELKDQIKDATELYNLVRSQRNKFANLMQASAISIAEMKDKLTTISTEVESLQSEVKYKDKVLTKQRAEYDASVKGRTQLLSELTRSAHLLREKHEQGDEYELEVQKLEGFVSAAERAMTKTRKLYGLEVAHRNQTGISLIDRNDELCILYEKSNVQMEVLKHSEVELHKRADEIRYLKIQDKHLQQKIIAAYKTAPNFSGMFESLKSLRQQLANTRTTTAKLSDLVENPDNLSRWKLLPGSDLSEVDLHLKITAYDEFLSGKADEALEKDLILEEVTALIEDLAKESTNSGNGYRGYLEQTNHYQRFLNAITQRVMSTVSELSLCQATIMSMTEEKERLHAELLQSYDLLIAGESPSETATREWLAKEREIALVMKWKEEKENKKMEQERNEERRKINMTAKTTAERRPNAYIEEELGLPKPFGLYSPFKPSYVGSQIRHFKNPDPKPLEI